MRSAPASRARLAGVDQPAGATIVTDLDAGTFTFRAARAGTYYVSFVVTAAPKQATGIARIDVSEQPKTPPTPIAVLDVALLPPGGEVVIDPLANDIDLRAACWSCSPSTCRRAAGLEVAILGHHLLRISSTRALDGAVIAHVHDLRRASPRPPARSWSSRSPPRRAQQPPVVPNATATVRTGGVVTIPVLRAPSTPTATRSLSSATLVEAPAAGRA